MRMHRLDKQRRRTNATTLGPEDTETARSAYRPRERDPMDGTERDARNVSPLFLRSIPFRSTFFRRKSREIRRRRGS